MIVKKKINQKYFFNGELCKNEIHKLTAKISLLQKDLIWSINRDAIK